MEGSRHAHSSKQQLCRLWHLLLQIASLILPAAVVWTGIIWLQQFWHRALHDSFGCPVPVSIIRSPSASILEPNTSSSLQHLTPFIRQATHIRGHCRPRHNWPWLADNPQARTSVKANPTFHLVSWYIKQHSGSAIYLMCCYHESTTIQ